MTDVFTWDVTTSSSGGGSFRTKKTDFGDGYSQEVEDGLNSEVQTVSVSVEGTEAEMRDVVAFARAHKAQSFFWTPPLSDQAMFRCSGYKWSPQDGGTRFIVTMDFVQSFVP